MATQDRPRIRMPLAILSVVLLALAGTAGWYIRHSQRSVADAMGSNLASLRAGQELELSTHELRCQIDRYLISSDFKQLEPIPRYRQRAETALQAAEAEATTSEEQRLMKRTRAGFDAFFAEFDRLSTGPPNRDGYLEILLLMDTVFSREVLEPTREYMRLNEGMLSRGSKENQELSSRVLWALVGLGLCGMIGGGLAGWLVASSFRRILKQHEARLRMTAQQLNKVMPKNGNEHDQRSLNDPVEDISKKAAAVIARLQQTERDALRAEQLAWVGQMAAGIAHEVRNPLMIVKMVIQARADGRNRERLRPKDMQVLQEEIIRMEGIITTFLNFARPPRVEKKMSNIGTLVAQVIAGSQGRAALQGVSLEACLPAQPLQASVDPNQLCQVLYNLIFNALDAQPSGGTVSIRLNQTDIDDEAMIEFVVEDEGPGIAEDMSDKIFEPFVSTKDTGMGLGLSICRRIIESHGGTIHAMNRDDRQGARFVVYLPISQAETEMVADVGFLPMLVK